MPLPADRVGRRNFQIPGHPGLAGQLADRGITVNTVNPGPVDTGYAAFAGQPDAHEAVRRHFPQGRWGTPNDPARLIAWLITDEAAWITGQVISFERGFRGRIDPRSTLGRANGLEPSTSRTTTQGMLQRAALRPAPRSPRSPGRRRSPAGSGKSPG